MTTCVSVPFVRPARGVSRRPGSRPVVQAKPVATRGTTLACSKTPTVDETTLDAIRHRAAHGAIPGASPFPLLTNRGSTYYSHVSPGVCDACANSWQARSAWVVLLLGQLPSHRANLHRTFQQVGAGTLGNDFTDRYEEWEEAYVEYLEGISSSDESEQPEPNQGATLLDMVDEKERLLRRFGIDDLFAGMKAQENAVATALFGVLANEIDGIWQPTEGSLQLKKGPLSDAADDEEKQKRFALQTVLECCLAGNLFDAGAAAAVAGVADISNSKQTFERSSDQTGPSSSHQTGPSALDATALGETFAEARKVVRRVGDEKGAESGGRASGWRFDSFDALADRATTRPWRRVVIFCDNAGADVMGMTLLARTLAGLGGSGTKVVLASNESAALNDVTHCETVAFLNAVTETPSDQPGGISGTRDALLGAQLNGGQVTCVSSGQVSTLLDLNRTGSALNAWISEEMNDVPAGNDWLVVFDGMGVRPWAFPKSDTPPVLPLTLRALESNWNVASHVKKNVNTLNLAMVKSEINARRLDAEVYDCVVKLGVGK